MEQSLGWQIVRISRYKLIRCRAQASERALSRIIVLSQIRKVRARNLARGNELIYILKVV